LSVCRLVVVENRIRTWPLNQIAHSIEKLIGGNDCPAHDAGEPLSTLGRDQSEEGNTDLRLHEAQSHSRRKPAAVDHDDRAAEQPPPTPDAVEVEAFGDEILVRVVQAGARGQERHRENEKPTCVIDHVAP
jgi:hypothetical protein